LFPYFKSDVTKKIKFPKKRRKIILQFDKKLLANQNSIGKRYIYS